MKWSRVRIQLNKSWYESLVQPILFINQRVITIAEKEFNIGDHFLVPKHTKLSDKDKDALLEEYKVTAKELPKISVKDPAIAHLDPSTDDIIKIERASPTSKTTVFYRKVIK